MALLSLSSYYYFVEQRKVAELTDLSRSRSKLKCVHTSPVNVTLQWEGVYSDSMNPDFSSVNIVRGLFVHVAMRLNNWFQWKNNFSFT